MANRGNFRSALLAVSSATPVLTNTTRGVDPEDVADALAAELPRQTHATVQPFAGDPALLVNPAKRVYFVLRRQ